MSLPKDHQQSQDAPVNLSFEQFQGVNTSTTRPGVPDNQAYWLDGFMPLAPGNLRTLYGKGTSIFSPVVGEVGSVSIVGVGSGGLGGPFSNVPLTGGSGSGAQATISLTGGSVTSVVVTAPGQNYSVSDVLSASSGNIGGTTGFSVSVVSIVNPTLNFFYFYNIGSNPYAVTFMSDGSAYQINTSTSVSTVILPPGTITKPSITNVGVSQWGSQYLIICANQTNGYWIWDGSLLYTAGTLAPAIALTSTGAGYVSPPLVTATGGSGGGASFVATISAGFVSKISFTNPGHNYLAGDSVSLVFTGGTQAGSGASLSAVLSHQSGGSGASLTCNMSGSGFSYVSSVTINNGGSGYSPEAIINVSGGVPITPAVLSPIISGGIITGVDIVNAGDYQTSTAPSAVLSDPGYYYVSNVSIVSGGSGYGPNRAITASGGGSPISQATFSSNTNSGGTITSVVILSGGNYGSNSAPTLTVTDSASSASATVSVMPYGIQGTSIETYQGHVWVFNGNVFNFTAPGSVSNFATSAGGGSQQSSSSYLKVGYTNAVSTNGFLFLIGDSSMDYISGVQTSGSVATTTYTQNNSDPEIGTPYPAAVTTLGQDILIANSTGIFVSSGGAFVKISEMMDGVYTTVPATEFNSNPFNGFQLSAAKATIFGKRVWLVLVPIVDPVSNSTVNKLLMVRDQKIWWASQQDFTITFIQGQEINSIYTAWGTDGTYLYPMFQLPSSGFNKVARTKLWFDPGGYETTKTSNRFWSVWRCYNTTATGFSVSINTIDGNNSSQAADATYSITGPINTGYFVTPPQAVGQQGIATGMTITTNATDMALVSAKIGDMSEDYRG